MSKLVELQQQRATLVKQMRSFVDGIDNAKGMTSEESARFDTMNADLDKIDAAIKREEQVIALEEGLDEFQDNIHRPAPVQAGNESPTASAEYISHFENMVRGGVNPDIRAALTIGEDAEGGYTVPETWESQLIQKLTDNVVMRQIATVIPTTHDRNLPIVTDNGSAGWIDEKATYPESDIAFGNKKLEAFKLGRIIKVSEELMQDSITNLVAEISRVFGFTFGLAEEAAFFTGDGNKKPTGAVHSAEVGKKVAAANAITYDELIDLVHSVREVYRMGANWTMRSNTAGMLRKLKSGDGVPLWQPSLQAGQPDVLMGYALRTTEAMPAVATSAKPILFGNFSEYRIADRGGIFMQRLDELYSNQGLIGFRMRKRVDGKLAVPEAVKSLEMG